MQQCQRENENDQKDRKRAYERGSLPGKDGQQRTRNRWCQRIAQVGAKCMDREHIASVLWVAFREVRNCRWVPQVIGCTQECDQTCQYDKMVSKSKCQQRSAAHTQSDDLKQDPPAADVDSKPAAEVGSK